MTEADVYELTREANDLVNEAFVRGDRMLTDNEIETTRNELSFELEAADFDVAGLKDKADAIMGDEEVQFSDGVVIDGSEYSPGDALIDAAMASEVRRHLQLTREQAAHDGLWRHLAVIKFHEFVRYRWPYPDPQTDRSLSAARDKYLEGARDLYEHALVRFWWIAELTRAGNDYSRTTKALERQELANDLFDRGYARYPPAVRATIDVLADANSHVVSRTTTKLNHALSTIRLEALNESELRDIIKEIKSNVQANHGQ